MTDTFDKDFEAVMDALATIERCVQRISGFPLVGDGCNDDTETFQAMFDLEGARRLAVNFLRNYGDEIRDMQGERDNLRQIVIEAGIAAEAYHVAANKCVRGDEIVHDRSLTEAANDFHAKTYHRELYT